MHKVIVILFATLALIVATDANAHLIAKPKNRSLSAINASQLENLKHARYVCNHGANASKRWNCRAVKWLKREYNETEAKLHPRMTDIGAWSCIHGYEGAWNANTGNGYYGGLQMDIAFQAGYGGEFLRRWGTADNWPPWAQIRAARRARDSGRGYYPWPNTARACGLI
jgi:hypothetical protein